MNVLAFDVGGTSMKYGIVSSSLEIVKKGILDTPNNEIEFLNAINQIIESYKNESVSYTHLTLPTIYSV